jgi:hypothetical protein
MTRTKAFFIHLFSSMMVLSLIFVLIDGVWYPGKLFQLAAGFDLLRLIVCVDLVLGPLIMLIIFNPTKKYLKLDVAIILLFQIGFLAYGCWIMFSARPAYFAFVENHFYLVRANEIDEDSLQAASNPQFKKIPLSGPIPVGTKQPDDIKIRNDIALSAIGGMGIQDLPQYFVPFSQVQQQVLLAGKTSQELKMDHNTQKRVAAFEEAHKRSDKKVLFIPMVNKRVPLIVAVDANTAQIIEII